jgi:hypothetical protein
MEKVPLMIAWLPTTDASIASTSTGHRTLSALVVAQAQALSINTLKICGTEMCQRVPGTAM